MLAWRTAKGAECINWGAYRGDILIAVCWRRNGGWHWSFADCAEIKGMERFGDAFCADDAKRAIETRWVPQIARGGSRKRFSLDRHATP